ncbi:MAG: exo-alpha-sialidase [Clostridia bacterium]|nr:exo-alpha-sialidase [Clostridia bacterium]
MRRYPVKKEVRLGGNESSKLFTDALPNGLIYHEEAQLITVKGAVGKVLYEAAGEDRVCETRGTYTPAGELMVMFPVGKGYTEGIHANRMVMFRSKDDGRSWTGPISATGFQTAQHGFIPLIPKGSKDIYCFGTQPVEEAYKPDTKTVENAPIGFYVSHDDGYTWNGPKLIRPEEDPDYQGMSVTRMCETDSGAWIIGSHEAYWHTDRPLETFQYVLRSIDKGNTWRITPPGRRKGFQCPGYERMDEGRAINLGNGRVLMMIRTPSGRLYKTLSRDDGVTWDTPSPTPLVHPDAPAMIVNVGSALLCLHHNRHHDRNYSGLSGSNEETMADRSELWASFSYDEGETWTEPRLIFANACLPGFDQPFYNHQISYTDMIVKDDEIHFIIPHLWHRVVYMRLSIEDIKNAPTIEALSGN